MFRRAATFRWHPHTQGLLVHVHVPTSTQAPKYTTFQISIWGSGFPLSGVGVANCPVRYRAVAKNPPTPRNRFHAEEMWSTVSRICKDSERPECAFRGGRATHPRSLPVSLIVPHYRHLHEPQANFMALFRKTSDSASASRY